MTRDTRRRILDALPPGFTLGYPQAGGDDQRTRSVGGKTGHPYVLEPDGRALRGPNGVPIKVGTSYHNETGIRRDLQRIKRALEARENARSRGAS